MIMYIYHFGLSEQRTAFSSLVSRLLRLNLALYGTMFGSRNTPVGINQHQEDSTYMHLRALLASTFDLSPQGKIAYSHFRKPFRINGNDFSLFEFLSDSQIHHHLDHQSLCRMFNLLFHGRKVSYQPIDQAGATRSSYLGYHSDMDTELQSSTMESGKFSFWPPFFYVFSIIAAYVIFSPSSSRHRPGLQHKAKSQKRRVVFDRYNIKLRVPAD